LAAGKTNRFVPFTYEKQKGLFHVKGEILIERQIEQLREAGVKEIYVVVGYRRRSSSTWSGSIPGCISLSITSLPKRETFIPFMLPANI